VVQFVSLKQGKGQVKSGHSVHTGLGHKMSYFLII